MAAGAQPAALGLDQPDTQSVWAQYNRLIDALAEHLEAVLVEQHDEWAGFRRYPGLDVGKSRSDQDESTVHEVSPAALTA